MKYRELEHIYLYKEPVNLNKGIDCLFSIVESIMELDTSDNQCIFFFINKKHNNMRGIQYDFGRTSIHTEKTPYGTYKWKRYCSETVTDIDQADFE